MSDQCCYLCGSDKKFTRDGTVRDNPEIMVLECVDCGLVYLSTSKHISDEHYEESGMHDGENADVDKWLKETQTDDERRYLFLKDKIANKNILDFGCGAGGFLAYANQSSGTAVGVELEKSLQPSFESRNLVVYPNIKSALNHGGKYDLITAFHVVEHLPDPISVLKELSLLLEDGGELIVEVPSSDDALLTLYKCAPFQNFTYWSQHLFLFNAKTFSELVKQSGLNLKWIKHIQRYPLSNHLHWLSTGKAGGHQKWDFMNDEQLNVEYENRLATAGLTDTIIAGISK